MDYTRNKWINAISDGLGNIMRPVTLHNRTSFAAQMGLEIITLFLVLPMLSDAQQTLIVLGDLSNIF